MLIILPIIIKIAKEVKQNNTFNQEVWAENHGLLQIPKASKRERNEGCETEVKTKQGNRPNSADPTGKFPDHDHRESGGNNHPCVKPVHVCAWLVRLISREGDIILDPFAGSGTTGVACKMLKRDFIGIDIVEDHCKIAEARIAAEKDKMGLFNGGL